MKITFNIGDKQFKLSPFDTKKEKEVLLLTSFDIYEIDQILELFGFEHNNELSEEEKKVILYKYREISLGDEIDLKVTCDNCGLTTDTVIEANNFIIEPSEKVDGIKPTNEVITDKNLQDFVDIDVDELDIDEYEELLEKAKNSQTRFNFIKTCRCLSCNFENLIDIGTKKFIIDSLSDETLMTIYKSYHFLNFFGKYTLNDVNKMLPFERSILIGLIQSTKEDLKN